MISILRKLRDWCKYERLHHYPALRAFDKDEALKRLLFYEQEERKACQIWLRLSAGYIALIAVFLLFAAFHYPLLGSSIGAVVSVPGWIVQYVMFRRIRRRVNAKVDAELKNGRLSKCYECGYDLRASTERCPECGAEIKPHFSVNHNEAIPGVNPTVGLE